ncbi:MAG: hypothetical protein JWN44_2212 [Myxococcales bacterium]|nr:hypothetical protein [Myxococcales bacterium]
MIQYGPVRAIAIVAVTLAVAAQAGASGPAATAIYWEPPGHPAPAVAARAGFVAAAEQLGARVVDAPLPSPPAEQPLAPLLQAAKADHAAVAIAAALARLDELDRLSEARGGADLDARQLSDIYFYRWLCKSEAGHAEAAWDDLVRAARLDPTRVVDSALLPPRAVAAYRRAADDVARLPRAELRVEAPADANVRVDGAAAAGPTTVTMGRHFLAVSAVGYEPWAGVVNVQNAQERITPPLRAWQPPDGDRALALAGSSRRVIVGALVRAAGGWQFVVRDVAADGQVATGAVALTTEAPVRAVVSSLVARVAQSSPARVQSTADRGAQPPARRWWPWVVGGAAAGVVIVAVTLGVVLGTSAPSGTVAGNPGL